MQTAKLFQNGASQAVRLPKNCRLAGSEVYIKKFDNLLMLFPKKSPWLPLVDSLNKFSDDFMTERRQPSGQLRRGW